MRQWQANNLSRIATQLHEWGLNPQPSTYKAEIFALSYGVLLVSTAFFECSGAVIAHATLELGCRQLERYKVSMSGLQHVNRRCSESCWCYFGWCCIELSNENIVEFFSVVDRFGSDLGFEWIFGCSLHWITVQRFVADDPNGCSQTVR